MSMLLDTALLGPYEITDSKYGEPKTSSILLIAVAITMAVVLLMFAGLSFAEGMYYEQYSICRDKIIGYEQHGS